MRNVEYNYMRNIFPFILTSKFNLSFFKEQPSIKKVEFSIDIDNKKNLPEILFWVLFSINNKRSYVSHYFKKKHVSGKSILSKIFLKISKVFGNKKKVIYNLNRIYQKMVLYCQEIKLIKSFPNKDVTHRRVLLFSTVSFEDKYQTLMNLAPNSWTEYDLKFILFPSFINGFHFRFFLQNLQLPVF